MIETQVRDTQVFCVFCTHALTFEQADRKKPYAAENHFYLGRFFLARKKYSTANLQLKKTVFIAPDKATYHFWLGVSYGGLNKTALELSGFGIPEHINTGNRNYTLDESINLFAVLK